jgi:deazaflavin-dependent oxidoreductase (nitroreductase family)
VRNRVINPLVRALLRSPAHRLMSRGVLLLTYTGRRSGRRYTLPVQYARADHGLILWPAHHDRKRWWRNLQPAAPVRVRVAGRELHGTAQVLIDDPAQIADALTIFLARFPSARRVLGVPVSASSAAIRQAAEHQIVVRISTDDQPANPRHTEHV